MFELCNTKQENVLPSKSFYQQHMLHNFYDQMFHFTLLVILLLKQLSVAYT